MSHGNQTIKKGDAELLILSELLLFKTHSRNISFENPTELSSSKGSQASGLVSTDPDGTEARVLENDHFCQPVFRAYHKATYKISGQQGPERRELEMARPGTKTRGARSDPSRDQDRRSQIWLPQGKQG